MRTITTVVAALLLVIAGSSFINAGNVTKTVETGRKATFTGKLVCLGCDLKMTEGAHAECKTYGHRHALKTSDGKYINFLENKYSEVLLNGDEYGNKTVTVEGTYYANADMLDVHSFTVDGKQKGWCGSCKKMDSCPYKKSGLM